ncbi:MAG: 2-amino-4-hydroxy-6-hydroxymethyldihydropteridine diphosphokinase [Zoogloeaceae bacterium]|jgi:2-amino-4-hydroxy-6-hydroxymethyldihydropteridine diphosphokinase|nr:2-amino-4-hydroxy-6-hydroxymethyldihydropteridine diphosphokinase [Zoogloeaceae bacterium]
MTFDLSPPPLTTAYIALGANLGAARQVVQAAIAALGQLPHTRLLAASALYRTAPVGLANQPDFINAVAAVQTTLEAPALLYALQAEEARQGRIRSIPNAPRTLDLDLLLYGERVLNTPFLTLPHPRLHLRAFVLAPLAEIAPDLSLPGRSNVRAWLPAVAMQRITRLSPESV